MPSKILLYICDRQDITSLRITNVYK